MTQPISRRTALKAVAAGTVAAGAALLPAPPRPARRPRDGWVAGHMTGARALVETLLAEGTACVFGIPGAQENELWDAMKRRGLPYLLVRTSSPPRAWPTATPAAPAGPACICVVPGPGVTNALTGLGEALLDSVPMVCIVGDVARGDKYHPFQVHELPQVGLLQPVTKGVFAVTHVGEIPGAVRQAFQLAMCRRAGAGRRRRAVQPAHRDVQVPLPAARAGRRALRRGRLPVRPGPAERPQAARRHLRRPGLHGLRPAAGAGSPRCCRRRWRPASPARASSTSATRWRSAGATGRRARAPPRTPSRTSIWCWPSACASARCPPASTRSRSTRT